MKDLPLTIAAAVSFGLILASFASPSVQLTPQLVPEVPLQELPAATDSKPDSESDQGVTDLLSNVQLIGASITAGYGDNAELKVGPNVPLAEFLRAAWADRNQGGRLEGKGNFLFFRSPKTAGKSQVANAKAAVPSLVIAIDFLFWYAYGRDYSNKPRRAKGLEQGLKELETFDCPLIIGTLPNVEHALRGNGPGGRAVIARSQFPTEEQRVAMNERINAWAAERELVEVVDVDGMFRAIVAGEPVKIYGEEFKTTALTDAFQKDLLHLSLEGYVWTALAVCQAISRQEGATDDDFVRDPAKIRERFLASIKAAQAKQAERVAKRLARKAARDARKESAIR